MLYDISSNSDRSAETLLNKALSRTKESCNLITAKTISDIVTDTGNHARKEIAEVMNAYNVLYGFDGAHLIPGVHLNPAIVEPKITPSVTKEEVLEAFYYINSYKLDDSRKQIDFKRSLETIDLNPTETTYIFLDDVGTPRQKDIRRSPNHEGVPRATKRVQTTNGVVLSKEGRYYFCASDTEEMFMILRGFLLKNHLLENRKLVCFSDGAKTIWSNFDEWFEFRPRTINSDWYHLKHKSNELFTRILVGYSSKKDEIEKIKRDYFHILWTGNVRKAIAYLRSIDKKYLKKDRTVDLLVEYLENKQKHHTIPVFAMRKHLSQVNASSLSESANNSMTTSKQKKQGKSWSVDGSHSKTTWRNLYANNEDDNFLYHRRLHLSPVPFSKNRLAALAENNVDIPIPSMGEE